MAFRAASIALALFSTADAGLWKKNTCWLSPNQVGCDDPQALPYLESYEPLEECIALGAAQSGMFSNSSNTTFSLAFFINGECVAPHVASFDVPLGSCYPTGGLTFCVSEVVESNSQPVVDGEDVIFAEYFDSNCILPNKYVVRRKGICYTYDPSTLTECGSWSCESESSANWRIVGAVANETRPGCQCHTRSLSGGGEEIQYGMCNNEVGRSCFPLLDANSPFYLQDPPTTSTATTTSSSKSSTSTTETEPTPATTTMASTTMVAGTTSQEVSKGATRSTALSAMMITAGLMLATRT